MRTAEVVQVDILIDGEEDGLLTVAMSAGDFSLQWHSLPDGGLGAMQLMLSAGAGEDRELCVGEILGAHLRLVLREGIFSFKSISTDSSTDLFRIDLPPGVVGPLMAALNEAVEDWEEQ